MIHGYDISDFRAGDKERIERALRTVPGVSRVTFDDEKRYVVLGLERHVSLDELNRGLEGAGAWRLSGEHMYGTEPGGLFDYIPLIVMFGLIGFFVLFRQRSLPSFDGMLAMRDAMAGFFLIFGGLKFVNLKGFVELFKRYDLLASRSTVYAWAYPFIEVSLGLAYLASFRPVPVAAITLLIMVFGAVGVILALRRGADIQCACLGSWVTIPLSWVTVGEYLAMAAMAMALLLK